MHMESWAIMPISTHRPLCMRWRQSYAVVELPDELEVSCVQIRTCGVRALIVDRSFAHTDSPGSPRMAMHLSTVRDHDSV
jgi:hypothetical protein